jgi:hypothetical protein
VRSEVTTLDTILDRQLKSRRLTTDLISGFASTALTASGASEPDAP